MLMGRASIGGTSEAVPAPVSALMPLNKVIRLPVIW